MQRIERMGAMLAVAVMLGLLAGCQGELGPIWTAKEYPPSTSVFKTEMEVVPNAQLVRVDTRPVTRDGRMAFTRGVDKVIVATRITAWADPAGENWLGMSRTPASERELRVREVERAWIAIPYGTREGERLQVEELQLQFQTGYDHREEESDGYYNKPHGMEGTISVVEEKPDVLVVEANLVVKPKWRADWYLQGRFDVPITYRGIHARMATESDQLIVDRIRPGADRLEQVPIGQELEIDGPNVRIAGTSQSTLQDATVGEPGSPKGNGKADADKGDDAAADPALATDDAAPAPADGPGLASGIGSDDTLNPSTADLVAPPDPNALNLTTDLFPNSRATVPDPDTAPTPTPSPTPGPSPAADRQGPADGSSNDDSTTGDASASKPADKPGVINPNAAAGDASVDPDAAQAEADAEAEGDKVPTEIDGKSIVGKWYVNTTGHEFRWQFFENGVFIYAVSTGPIGQVGGRAPTWTAGKFRLRSNYVIMNTHKYFENNTDQTENLSARFALAKLSWQSQGDKQYLVLEGDLKGSLGRVRLRMYPKDFVDLDAFELMPGRPQPDPVDEQSRVSGPLP